MSHRYKIYGVQLVSDRELQAPIEDGQAVNEAQCICIRWEKVPTEPPPELIQTSACAAISPTAFWLHIPNVARFYCPNNATILIQPEPDADEQSVELFLLGAVLGPLLRLRKLLVMHANVVELEYQGRLLRLMLCGHSASGKSTFAAYLLKKYNAKLIADDLAVFDARGEVQLGSPLLKIWEDAKKAIGLETENLTEIRPQVSKFDWHVDHLFASSEASIDVVLLMSADNEADVGYEEVSGTKKLRPLQTNVYRYELTKDAGLDKLQFMLLTQYLGRTPLIRLHRRRSSAIRENLKKMSAALFECLDERDFGDKK